MERSSTKVPVARFWIRHIALPQDHGSWVFLLSPLLIGLFSGVHWTAASLPLIIAAMAAFLIRQPVTISVKAYSGRRSQRDLAPAWFWILVYGLIGAIGLTGLIWLGYSFLLLLAIPGIPVFIWHLFLVSRRAERRQMGVELVGSGVLALAAPAAYWVNVGSPDPTGWLLFALSWLQSAASIVFAYFRLDQRTSDPNLSLSERFQMGRRSLVYATFNLLLVIFLGMNQNVSPWLFLPFTLQWLETLRYIYKPAIHEKPTAIGIRQLIISTLFTILFIITWNIGLR